jgi:hypothetical protein
MPKTEIDPLGSDFESRLRSELDGIQPRFSSPRYLSAGRHHVGSWRFAPAGLAVGIVGILALSAYAATGSANPVVWTQRIVTTIQPNVAPEASPTPASNPTPSEHSVAPVERPEATPRAEPSDHAEPSPQPSPGSDDPSSATPSPSPPTDR